MSTQLTYYTVKQVLFLCLSFLFGTVLHAQDKDRSTIYSDYKGLTVHLLVQPAWHSSSVFDKQLQTLGYPSQRRFGFHLGLGASYLFKTGTSVGLEFASLSQSLEKNGSFTQVQPHLYLLNVKQYFIDMQKARFFVGASLLGVEQQYTISQPGTSPTSLTQVITTPNNSRFQRLADAVGGSIGITFKGEHPNTQSLTDFVEMEVGYRMNMGKPFYTVGALEFEGLVGDRFRQFYISMRAGLFVRRKLK